MMETKIINVMLFIWRIQNNKDWNSGVMNLAAASGEIYMENPK